MTFKEFKDNLVLIEHEDKREGEALMNYLEEVWNKEYKRLYKSYLDCFYNDARIPLILKHLEISWKNYPN